MNKNKQNTLRPSSTPPQLALEQIIIASMHVGQPLRIETNEKLEQRKKTIEEATKENEFSSRARAIFVTFNVTVATSVLTLFIGDQLDFLFHSVLIRIIIT